MKNYLKGALKPVKVTEEGIIEESAVMYINWLILPSSCQIGIKVANMAKKEKFEIRKTANELNRLCNKSDIMMGNFHSEDELKIYDQMLVDYRNAMFSEEQNIRDCFIEHFDGLKDNEILAEIAFAFVLAKTHRATMILSNEKLKKENSYLTFNKIVLRYDRMIKLLARLGELYEIRNGVKESIFSTTEDKESVVVGLKDAIDDYNRRLLNDSDMHKKIQSPLAEFKDVQDELARQASEEIYNTDISVLGLKTSFVERNGLKTIRDLYNEENTTYKSFDWTDEEKNEVLSSLTSYVKKTILGVC